MPVAIPNGGGSDVTTPELTAYANAQAKSPGDRNAAEQGAIDTVDGKVDGIAGGWVDSGGPGGFQFDVRREVTAFTARLEAARAEAINQYAKSSDPRKANREMHGADSQFIVEIYRQLLEAINRLNASPY